MSMHPRIPGPALAAAALAAALVGGCSSGSTGNAPGAAASPPAVGGYTEPNSWRAAMLSMPLSSYTWSDTDETTFQNATTILTNQCMHGKGYASFNAADHSVTIAAPAQAQSAAGAWGYIDTGEAATEGFHTAVQATAPAGAALTGAELTAQQACAAQAAGKIQPNGTSAAAASLVNSLFQQSTQEVGTDQRYQAGAKKWAQCMQRQGFTASDPAELGNRSNWPGSKASSTEIATAEADASCTASTKLAGLYFALLSGYQTELVNQNAQQLQSVAAATKAEIAKAASVVSNAD